MKLNLISRRVPIAMFTSALAAMALSPAAHAVTTSASGGSPAPQFNIPVQMTGAIFTTNSTGTQVNGNIYANKGAVYLNGGPGHPGAAGLPDGNYWVQVTEPNGTLLGKSNSAIVNVTGGEFAQLYQLSSILYTASSGFVSQGYDTTSNSGGEYKVWVCKNSTFRNNESKTDNFKVGNIITPPPTTLRVIKFYDANANGENDDNQIIEGWRVGYKKSSDVDFTIGYTTWVIDPIDPDTYDVTEADPIETNWVHTTPNNVEVTLAAGDNKTVEFGNLCIGDGGGHTLGFWSNKNGQAMIGAGDLAMLTALNLRNANGSSFDPSSNSALRTWLLNGTATNMAYMLSVQLSAMELNVYNLQANGSQLIYAPNTNSANSLGFAPVNAVMAEANALLGANGSILSGSPDRPRAEALKNALDWANNNLTFVHSTPCTFTFPEIVAPA